ncbi:MAG: Swt1 family HEPN domain-containing protein, partial [Nitrososphaeria archaeon]
MSEASSTDYIALYNEIRNFESNLRSFIKCKLQQSWGKGWLEQLKNVLPNEYKEWESRAEKDKLAKENKELIEYMDFSDYIRIFDKFDKIFTHNTEEKSEILALLKNIKDIRDHTMHFRSGITRD